MFIYRPVSTKIVLSTKLQKSTLGFTTRIEMEIIIDNRMNQWVTDDIEVDIHPVAQTTKKQPTPCSKYSYSAVHPFILFHKVHIYNQDVIYLINILKQK